MEIAENTNNHAGFTLIELLIVTTISALLLLTVSSVLMTFMLSNNKSGSRQKVVSEGKFALSQMEFLLRNSIKLVPNINNQTCEANMDSIAFSSIDGQYTELLSTIDSAASEESGGDGVTKIASMAGLVNPYFLTSDAVTIDSGPSFNCVEEGNNKYVEITFTLSKNPSNNFVPETFNSRINLRN